MQIKLSYFTLFGTLAVRLSIDFMSSEEGDIDGGEEVLKSHKIPWWRDLVTRMFNTLDADAAKAKTPQSIIFFPCVGKR